MAKDNEKKAAAEQEAKPAAGKKKSGSNEIRRLLAKGRKYKGTSARRLGILFSGGPAPGGNAVISAASLAALNDGWEVVGFNKGYAYLETFDRQMPRLFKEGVHYRRLGYEDVTKIRQIGGVVIKTSRANPSKTEHGEIRKPEDLLNPKMAEKLHRVLDALEFIGVQALISIGGDDTLKTAYYLHLLGVPVVHVPKTIDNDYYGIPWTFGYFTAIEHARQAVKVYNQEAQTTDAWWILELMGRKTGWYTLGAGISGEAVRMIGPEEVGAHLDINELANSILELILQRERIGKNYGVVLISEGLVDRLPPDQRPQEVDMHGNVKFSEAYFGRKLAKLVGELYKEEKKRRGEKDTKLQIKSENIGYTTRCVEPSAFDILLGSQLGMGAFKFVNEGNHGTMVSVGDNMELRSVPFEELIDPATFRTRLRYVPIHGDFFKMAKALEFRRRFDV